MIRYEDITENRVKAYRKVSIYPGVLALVQYPETEFIEGFLHKDKSGNVIFRTIKTFNDWTSDCKYTINEKHYRNICKNFFLKKSLVDKKQIIFK